MIRLVSRAVDELAERIGSRDIRVWPRQLPVHRVFYGCTTLLRTFASFLTAFDSAKRRLGIGVGKIRKFVQLV